MTAAVLGPLLGMVAGALFWSGGLFVLGWRLTSGRDAAWGVALKGIWIGALLGGVLGFKAFEAAGLILS
ncbi:hypothetical protein LJR090_000990 [Bosea sp. LjRoot90]|uniref:hypothetical protein n=1 Tax=Bosea sp. LjRoot90 TaxID=3342342 RepID=UPI003ECD3176